MTAALTPPNSLEAEESIVGGVLVHPKAIASVAATVQPEDFYHPALRAIWEAIADLFASSRPIDTLTVVEQMRGTATVEKLRAFGGPDYLAELTSKVVTVENLDYHAGIVRSKARRRRCLDTFRELAAAAYAPTDDGDYFEAADSRMLALVTSARDESMTPRTMTQVMHEYFQELERRRDAGGAITGIATGYESFDGLLCGMQPGDLIIVAARPSMGKTAFGMGVLTGGARHVDNGVVVGRSHACTPACVHGLFFSLEMQRRQVAERELAGAARIDSQRLRSASLTTKQWIALSGAAGRVSELPVRILDRSAMTVAQIRAVAMSWRMALPGGARGFIVVDYLQLVHGRRTKDDNRQREIADISGGLKALAKDLDVPVVALAQLNRACESRTDKRPMLSDLRESGAIEQDADVIAFLYRDEYYSKDECRNEDRGVAEVIVRKQRMGATDTVRLAWKAEYARFENLANRSPQ